MGGVWGWVELRRSIGWSVGVGGAWQVVQEAALNSEGAGGRWCSDLTLEIDCKKTKINGTMIGNGPEIK